MNDARYKWTLYLIAFVILGTICIQVYWNYKNYLANKQQFVNDVQVSLDNAVDTYYTTLAEKNTIAFAFSSKNTNDFFIKKKGLDSILHPIDLSSKGIQGLDSLNKTDFTQFKIYKRFPQNDSLFNSTDSLIISKEYLHEQKLVIGKKTDSLPHINFSLLTSKVMISITSDTLKLITIDTFLQKELKRKNIDIHYGISFFNVDNKSKEINPEIIKSSTLYTESKSSFLPKESSLKVHFYNATLIILKRILTGILISTFLVLAIISSLFYLLNIIKHQKQLAEVKNDLISNITHEFKTPIATIGVALESIKNFNVLDDIKKTKDYLSISEEQLSKLNLIVEKLLETATLDSDSLQLSKEPINIIELLQTIVSKHRIQANGKKIGFNFKTEKITANVDVFHFENAINNIIDNAIKYGGNEITISLKQLYDTIEISISDTGNTLTKENKNKIFEKFYRVPKGNTHDVKGFGIGLYYAKKIIEKHNGTIVLDLKNKLTSFKISLPK